jgi:glycosyltransferase involved in cell wall biosynthesis
MILNHETYNPLTLILLAALNEEEGIGLTITELKKYLNSPEILVVDGNSKDATVAVAQSLGARVLQQEGKGKGNAINCAIKYITEDYDYIVLTDADYTYPAEFIPTMLDILEKNPEIGMVCGNRFNSHFQLAAMNDRFYLGNRLIGFTHNWMNGVNLHDPLTGLRVVRWSILNALTPKSASFDIEVEINNHVKRHGFTITEIDIPYRTRVGEKKLKLRHGFTIFNRILRESLY